MRLSFTEGTFGCSSTSSSGSARRSSSSSASATFGRAADARRSAHGPVLPGPALPSARDDQHQAASLQVRWPAPARVRAPRRAARRHRRPAARPLGRAAGALEFRGVSFAYDREAVLRKVSFAVAPAPGSGSGADRGRQDNPREPAPPLLRSDRGPGPARRRGPPRLPAGRPAQPVRHRLAGAGALLRHASRRTSRYARPEASEAEIEAAAQRGQRPRLHRALPRVRDHGRGAGMKLSGGERQRISLARAFLKDAPILILDEPTFGRPTTERLIMEAMERLMRGRTTFMIAHRLATLACATVRFSTTADGRERAARRGAGRHAAAWSGPMSTDGGRCRHHWPWARRLNHGGAPAHRRHRPGGHLPVRRRLLGLPPVPARVPPARARRALRRGHRPWCYDPAAGRSSERGRNAPTWRARLKALDPGLTERWFFRDGTGATYGGVGRRRRVLPDGRPLPPHLRLVLDAGRVFRGRGSPSSTATQCTPRRRWRVTWRGRSATGAGRVEMLRDTTSSSRSRRTSGPPTAGSRRRSSTGSQPASRSCWTVSRRQRWRQGRRRVLTTVASWEPRSAEPSWKGSRTGARAPSSSAS